MSSSWKLYDIWIGEILDMVDDMPLIVELYDYSLEHMLESIRESLDLCDTVSD